MLLQESILIPVNSQGVYHVKMCAICTGGKISKSQKVLFCPVSEAVFELISTNKYIVWEGNHSGKLPQVGVGTSSSKGKTMSG